jgi:hypothetical protein
MIVVASLNVGTGGIAVFIWWLATRSEIHTMNYFFFLLFTLFLGSEMFGYIFCTYICYKFAVRQSRNENSVKGSNIKLSQNDRYLF